MSSIPIVGGASAETFDLIYKSVYEKRLDIWRARVTRELNNQLEQNISLEELIKNEEFQSILAETTIIALRNHQEKKLKTLLNVVRNSTTSPIKYDFKKLFIGYIDQFTEYHLRMLVFIADNEKLEGKTGHKNSSELRDLILEDVFHKDESLFSLFHEELEVAKGMFRYRTKSRTIEKGKISFMKLTEMGKKFIDLIED